MTEKNKRRLLKHLSSTPIIQVACKKANVGRASYYRWRKEDAEFADAADLALEHSSALINDLAESQLIAAIKEKNMTAIMFWLKHHHKTYEARLKVDASVKHESQELSDEQAELVARALRYAGLLSKGGNDEPENTV